MSRHDPRLSRSGPTDAPRRRADAGRPVADYIGYLRGRGDLSEAQYLAATILRRYAEPPVRSDALARVPGAGRSGGVADLANARGVDARRRLMRIMDRLPPHVRPVLIQTVLRYRSLTELESSARARRRMRDDLRHALDLVAEALLEGHRRPPGPGAPR